jgi:hypothetical protein
MKIIESTAQMGATNSIVEGAIFQTGHLSRFSQSWLKIRPTLKVDYPHRRAKDDAEEQG